MTRGTAQIAPQQGIEIGPTAIGTTAASAGRLTSRFRSRRGPAFGTRCASRRCMSSHQPPHEPAGLEPPGLRPELVPSVEVVKVLPTVNDPAVLELEDNAVGHVQVLAVAIPGAVLEADHVAVVICCQVPQLGPERAVRLLCELAEILQDRVGALIVVGVLALAREMPHGVPVEDLVERVQVARVEGVVGALQDRYAFRCSHPSLLGCFQSTRDTTSLPLPMPSECCETAGWRPLECAARVAHDQSGAPRRPCRSNSRYQWRRRPTVSCASSSCHAGSSLGCKSSGSTVASGSRDVSPAAGRSQAPSEATRQPASYTATNRTYGPPGDAQTAPHSTHKSRSYAQALPHEPRHSAVFCCDGRLRDAEAIFGLVSRCGCWCERTAPHRTL